MGLGNISNAMSRLVQNTKQKAAATKAADDADLAAIEKNRGIAFAEKPETANNDAMNRKYETLRGRAKADVSQQTGEQQDALKRRFAQLGNLSSGASLKQEQLTAQKGAELQQRATEGIDMAQAQEQQGLEEQAKQREFARSERIGSQAFAAAESQMGRRQQERQFNASQNLAKSQFGEQMGMAAKQFALEEKIQKFNLEQANKKTGLAGLRGKVGSGDYMGAGEFVADPMGLWG